MCVYVRVCARLLHVCYVHSGSVSQSFFTYGTSFRSFIFVTFMLVGKESLDGPLRNLSWTLCSALYVRFPQKYDAVLG